MGKISTRELLDRFYADESYNQTRRNTVRNTIDNDLLFKYEEKIGKELVDMNKEETIQLVRVLLTQSLDPKEQSPILFYTYKQVKLMLTVVCEWYSYNIEPIPIWLRSPDLKGNKGLMKILETAAKPLEWQDLLDIFTDMRKQGKNDRADLIELLCGLFHCGFYELSEVINLKEKDINFRTRQVILPGRVVKLDVRTITLLQANHKATTFNSFRTSLMRSWNGSYMHFVVSPNYADTFDARPEKEVAIALNKLLSEYIRNWYDLKITFRNIYWLGMYDFFIEKCGLEHTKKLVMSFRNSDDINELLSIASEFGVSSDVRAADIKTRLRLYLPTE